MRSGFEKYIFNDPKLNDLKIRHIWIVEEEDLNRLSNSVIYAGDSPKVGDVIFIQRKEP